jgi:hypothetical protein
MFYIFHREEGRSPLFISPVHQFRAELSATQLRWLGTETLPVSPESHPSTSASRHRRSHSPSDEALLDNRLEPLQAGLRVRQRQCLLSRVDLPRVC